MIVALRGLWEVRRGGMKPIQFSVHKPDKVTEEHLAPVAQVRLQIVYKALIKPLKLISGYVGYPSALFIMIFSVHWV
jgi:hypothetical protein